MSVPLYLLDTSVVLHLIRGNPLAASIEASFQLTRQPIQPFICIVTHGELWSLARENSWGDKKRTILEKALANLTTIDIHSDDVIEAYVEVEHASRTVPRGAAQLSKNDLWIAATAKVTGATLLTCDRDFDHLDPGQIRRAYIDPRSALPPTPGATP